jgi:hypothetical protein
VQGHRLPGVEQSSTSGCVPFGTCALGAWISLVFQSVDFPSISGCGLMDHGAGRIAELRASLCARKRDLHLEQGGEERNHFFHEISLASPVSSFFGIVR